MARVGGISGKALLSFVRRAERLHEERQALAADLSEVFKEAKGRGFSVHALKYILARRRKDPENLAEEEAVIAQYLAAIGEVEADDADDGKTSSAYISRAHANGGASP